MIIDTSYLIHLMRQRPDAFQKGVALAEEGIVQRVPAPVVAELSYGVEMKGTEAERRRFDNVIRMYPVVELDRELSQRAGELLARADNAANGESGIDKIDPLIAAVADRIDEPVLTANVEHFERLNVDVETY